jgi:hypothetical protein
VEETKKPAGAAKISKAPNKGSGTCESCEFYDYDEYLDAYYCKVNLDQDDRERYMTNTNSHCPYYRYYDEYTSVRKQI